ncbi:endonuclease domain-containing protein [Streptomyces sp. NPDC057291]|uniref:endonuclease domain-containing protein n=1 Tax=Streptomyces sp. NPDC057291 TaxID=3346087 RepID=UPI003630AA82
MWRRPYSGQDGHCATCPGPAEAVDHSHRSGLVRGVLCYNCNHVEAPHARQVMLNIERANRCWFQSY